MAKINLELIGKDKGARDSVDKLADAVNRLNDNLEENSQETNKQKKNNKSMTASIVAAQVAFAALNLAVKGLQKAFQGIKESIKIASDFQETSSKFATVFKDVATQSDKMAKELQENFGLSSLAAKQLLSDTGDMLTGFGFAGEEALNLSNSVQELAVDLASFTNFAGGAKGASEALTKGLLGEREAMKSLGIAISEEMIKEELLRQGKEKLTGMALKQAKAEATLKLAIDQSKNAIGDYARTSDSYANMGRKLASVQEDIQIAIGKQLLPAFTEVRKEMLSAAEGFKKFVESAETIEVLQTITANVSGSFTVLKELFSDLAEDVFGAVVKEVNQIKNSFSNLKGEGEGTFKVLDLIAGVMKVLSIGLQVAVKIIGAVIQRFIDMAVVIKSVASDVGNFFTLLTNPKKWGELKDSFKGTTEAFKNMGDNMIEQSADIVNTVVDGFKSFPKDVGASADKYAKIFKEKSKEVKENFEEDQNAIQEKSKETSDQLLDDNKQIAGGFAISVAAAEQMEKNINKESLNKVMEGFANTAQQVEEVGGQIVDIINDFTGQAQEIVNMWFEEQFNVLEANKEEQLASVDDWIAREMEARGVAEETKVEQLTRELNEINNKIKNEQDAQKKADLIAKKAEIKKQLERAKIIDEGEKKKAKIEKEAAQKETELKKKQFNSDKAFRISQVWIDAASAVMGWWASFAPMGIPGIVLAGIMTTASLVMAGVQTGMIASQTFTGEQGGIIPEGATTGDNTILRANRGEALLRNDDFNNLVDMAKGDAAAGRSIIIENMTVMANDPDDFKTQMLDVALFEGNR